MGILVEEEEEEGRGRNEGRWRNGRKEWKEWRSKVGDDGFFFFFLGALHFVDAVACINLKKKGFFLE